MIPLPSWLASPLRLVFAIVLVVALGAGAVIGWRWKQDSDARKKIESVPAIQKNQVDIDTTKATQLVRERDYRAAAGSFRQQATAARSNPATPPAVRACYDAGVTVISRCDSLHRSDSSLIALYRQRSELMEEQAVRARRGKLVQLSTALGYEPFYKAPAARVGVELNFSDHWTVIGTADFAASSRDSTRRSGFVGLNYRFGGRNP